MPKRQKKMQLSHVPICWFDFTKLGYANSGTVYVTHCCNTEEEAEVANWKENYVFVCQPPINLKEEEAVTKLVAIAIFKRKTKRKESGKMLRTETASFFSLSVETAELSREVNVHYMSARWHTIKQFCLFW